MSLKIYLCAFKNPSYFAEANICIRSIREKGKFNGPIYLLTDQEVKDDLYGTQVIQTACESVYDSASKRLEIFHYIPDFNETDIILYLDTDIVVKNTIPDFKDIDENVNVYGYDGTFGYSQRSQNEKSFAGHIAPGKFTIHNGFCSGILLFRPTQKVKTIFENALELYKKEIQRNNINYCWEQPSLCYILIENEAYTISLNKYVMENRASSFTYKEGVIFNHFCGERGDQRAKRMLEHLES
jgi:lipopolysaccharide biosynthesis glycosyltransferase